jgi:hypothetical protein
LGCSDHGGESVPSDPIRTSSSRVAHGIVLVKPCLAPTLLGRKTQPHLTRKCALRHVGPPRHAETDPDSGCCGQTLNPGQDVTLCWGLRHDFCAGVLRKACAPSTFAPLLSPNANHPQHVTPSCGCSLPHGTQLIFSFNRIQRPKLRRFFPAD